MDSADRLSALLQRSLDALQAPFPQLVFLSSLRDPYTGRYLHEGWATIESAQEVHSRIRQTHLAVFQRVLQSSLAEMCLQLQSHFQTLEGETSTVAKLWLEAEPFREMMPIGCWPLERKFFIAQMTSALAALARCPDLWHPLARSAWLAQRPGPQPQPRREI